MIFLFTVIAAIGPSVAAISFEKFLTPTRTGDHASSSQRPARYLARPDKVERTMSPFSSLLYSFDYFIQL
jgi:hypothetical protein